MDGISIKKAMYGVGWALLLIGLLFGYSGGLFNFSATQIAFAALGVAIALFLVLSAQGGCGGGFSFAFTRFLLGILAMLVSFYFSWKFISGTAENGGNAWAAWIFVIVTESAKILFVADIARLGQHKGTEERVFWRAIGVAILFLLSISATMWNLTVAGAQGDMEAKAQDEQYQVLVDRANSVSLALSDARQVLADCPVNYIKNCKTPAQQRIDALLEQQAQISTAMQSYVPAAGGSVFWLKISTFFDSSADNVEMGWHFFRALLLEILGLVLIAQGSASWRFNEQHDYAPAAKVKLNEPVPALDVGGRILTDGLAYVHAGEVVVPAHEAPTYEAWKRGGMAVPNGNGAFQDGNGAFQDGNAPAPSRAPEQHHSTAVAEPERARNVRESSRGTQDKECCKSDIRRILMLNPGISDNKIRQELRQNGAHKGGNGYFQEQIKAVRGEQDGRV